MIEPIVMIANRVRTGPPTHQDRPRGASARRHANADYKNESYRTAIENYRKGLELDPSAKQVWRSLGLAAMALYRPGDVSPTNADYAKPAVEAFQNYLAAFPKDEKVREYLLTLLLNSEQFDVALAELEKAARENPSDPRLEEGIISVLLGSTTVPVTVPAWVCLPSA